MSHEWPGPDLTFRDAGTGEIIWRKEVNTGDVERGVAGDISAQYKGAECWATENYKVYNCKGEPVQIAPKTKSFLIYWDGDLKREMMRNNHIDDIQQGGLLTANGFESSPCDGAGPNISADLFGDWREEKK